MLTREVLGSKDRAIHLCIIHILQTRRDIIIKIDRRKQMIARYFKCDPSKNIMAIITSNSKTQFNGCLLSPVKLLLSIACSFQ